MDIHNYQTGEFIRTATVDEAKHYKEQIADDATGTGAVDGTPYGIDCTIYMED